MRPLRPALLPLLVALCGCALTPRSGPLDGARQLVTGDATFVIVYAAVDEPEVDEVARALEIAAAQVERWGKFEAPIIVRIHPSHDALEKAVRRIDYPWLRAWARYDSIDLQSPRTWGLLGGRKGQVLELLTHELTHCLMYQRAGTRSNWMRKGIPLWFSEGMASVTSQQGYRRPTDEELWRWLRAYPDADPVGDAGSLYQHESGVVYGSAHRAFEFLVGRYGDDTVEALLDAMKAGDAFDEAFERTVGIREDAFEREYLRYVKWEGWRGGQRARPTPLVVPQFIEDGSAGDPR